jgi:hypothetical protein
MRPRQHRFEDFGDLLSCLATPVEPTTRHLRPFFASAIEVDEDGQSVEPRIWVILHSITEAGLHLIHSRHLESGKLAVQIESPTGEILHIQLLVTSTDSRGELYESTAQFYNFEVAH